MKIHEYQGKQIFAKHGIPVPKGIPCFTLDEAEKAAEKIIAETGASVVVVKAQIHAGGRGKGTVSENPSQRGVQLVRSAAEAEAAARAAASR
jgi:succinyl-CoA synthetase beta subunit